MFVLEFIELLKLRFKCIFTVLGTCVVFLGIVIHNGGVATCSFSGVLLALAYANRSQAGCKVVYLVKVIVNIAIDNDN